MALDSIDDAERWIEAGVAACHEVWERIGSRYRRRLDEIDRVRDAEEDVFTLAARRFVPLQAPVLRPLPSDGLLPVARAFNGLDHADRYALRRLRELAPLRGARAEHVASAIERLADSLLAAPAGEDVGEHELAVVDFALDQAPLRDAVYDEHGPPPHDGPRHDGPRRDGPARDGPRRDGPRRDEPPPDESPHNEPAGVGALD